MRIAEYKITSYGEGPRANVRITVAGCSIRCKGCFNAQLWESKGDYMGVRRLMNIVQQGVFAGSSGVVIVGGEPTDQPVALAIFLLALRLFFPQMVVTLYTGHHLQKIRRMRPDLWPVLMLIDYLVDGPYVAGSSDPENLGYRGSSNQKVIDMRATRRARFRKIVTADWDNRIVFAGSAVSAPPKFFKGGLFDDDVKSVIAEECGRLGA